VHKASNRSDALQSNYCTMQTLITGKPMTSISHAHMALQQEAGAQHL